LGYDKLAITYSSDTPERCQKFEVCTTLTLNSNRNWITKSFPVDA